MNNDYEEMYDRRFITKVKRRGILRRFFNYVAIGAIAIQCVHTWTWDNSTQQIKRETSFIERSIGKQTVKSPIIPITGTVTIFVTQTGSSIFNIPYDWDNFNNTIEVIGSGASGTITGGGGGGAYSKTSNIFCIRGGFALVQVGAPGGYAAAGSWFNAANNSPPLSTVNGAFAEGGKSWYLSDTGQGGAAANGVGNVCYSGGYGGQSFSTGGGGGGAGGSFGAGGHGGIGYSGYSTQGGSGGGGGGGTNGIDAPAGMGLGPNGGQNHLGYGAGQSPYYYPHSPNGIDGGGGAGVTGAGIYSAPAGIGGNGIEYGNHGSGGGGGGSGSGFPPAGNGGNYGGGAGGSSSGGVSGTGSNGLVVISYLPKIATIDSGFNTSGNPYHPSSPSGPSAPAAAPPPDQYSNYYWGYGSWQDEWRGIGSAHYDNNYNRLLGLRGDDSTPNFDSHYDIDVRWDCSNETENEFDDKPRIWKSRSNEWLQDGGQRSVWCRHRVKMANNSTIPDIDPQASYITLTTNLLYFDEQTFGYRLSYARKNGFFNPGDLISQVSGNNTIYGTCFMIDSNYVYVYVPTGAFISNLPFNNADNPAINAFCYASVEMNEKYTANVFPNQSRYLCKSVILAEAQDSEDLKVYLGAYRPSGTNFKVYGKVISGTDPDLYVDRIWSRLTESDTSSILYSSATNLNDFIELVYDFPQSSLIFDNTASCGANSGSTLLLVPTANNFNSGDYVYLTDPSTGAFNVRKILAIPDNNTIELVQAPSFSNNTSMNVGLIPGLEDVTGAFLFDQNNNSMRYVTIDDVYYDSFKQFAIKIVPISDNPVIVPRITDMRSVALQV